MEIAVSLPTAIPGVDPRSLLEWARRAELRGFSTLAAGDRIVYPSCEPLCALAAAAAVTERIGLMTNVLIVPNRSNVALLAKQVATVDVLSGGRLTLGVGLGGRDDDYEVSGVSTGGRGMRLEAMLEELKRIWAGEQRGYAGAIGPAPMRAGGPPIMIGGIAEAVVRRTVRLGDGWTMGEGTVADFEGTGERVRGAWSEAGREGSPRLIALCYFALGDAAEATATSYIGDYYAWLGDPPDITLNVAVTPEAVQRLRDAFAQARADELIFFPCDHHPDQVDRLADCVL